MNTVLMNTVTLYGGKLIVKGGGSTGGGGGGDMPSGYDEFITAEGLVFSAVDEDFYVKL